MDSLPVSAIGLAAGGWQNVKLVSTIFIDGSGSKTTSTWKLGIAQIFSSAQGTINLIVTALVCSRGGFHPPRPHCYLNGEPVRFVAPAAGFTRR